MDLSELIEEIYKSKKYKYISHEVVERVCIDSCKKFKKKKDALGDAKKQLHIIYDSFLTNECHSIACKMIEAYSDSDIFNDQSFSKDLLSLHVSTKERLEYLSETYSFIAQYIHPECILSDVGCGFNPFALPFYSTKPAQYFAYEISQATVDVLNMYFAKGKAQNYHAELLDAVNSSPQTHSSLLLVLKLLPLLQQQKKGRAIEFLLDTPFEYAIVSFPIKSLSGKSKGMEAFYSSFIEENLPKTITVENRTIINNEMFYVLKK